MCCEGPSVNRLAPCQARISPSPLPSPSSCHFWDQPGLNLQHHCHSTFHYRDFQTLGTELAQVLGASPEIVLSQCCDLRLGSRLFFLAPASSKQQSVSPLIPSHLQTIAELWAAHSSLQDPLYFSFIPAFLLPSRSFTFFFLFLTSIKKKKNVEGLPWWLSGKKSTCQCRRHRFDPWVGKIPWRRKWQPTPVSLTRKCNGQRSLAGCSPWSYKRVGLDLVTKQQQNVEIQNTNQLKLNQIRNKRSKEKYYKNLIDHFSAAVSI